MALWPKGREPKKNFSERATLGDWERADHYLHLALDFYRRAEIHLYLARALLSLAQLFEKQDRSVEAQSARVEAEMLLAKLIP